MENEILKKFQAFSKGGRAAKYPFIKTHRQTYPIKTMCRILQISRQSYYDWRKRRKSVRAIDREILVQAIQGIYQEYKGRYGSPRIALELCKRDMFTRKNCIVRQMQRMGLENLHEAQKAVFEYTETFYNIKRIHSALGYLSPREYERKYT